MIKQFLIALFAQIMLFACAVSPDFYVWQRVYNNSVNCSIQEFYENNEGRIFFLAGEIENSGKQIEIHPSKSLDITRSTPVFRIHIKNMDKTPKALAADVSKLYATFKSANSLQIDLDAPESKLNYYYELMLELRKMYPNSTLSATVLPCHMKHRKQIAKLSEACDFYVLQVHGLTKESGEWSIYNHKVAKLAIANAKKIGKPFKVALPMYANLLSQQNLVQPNLYEVAELAKQCDEIIVFRLGNQTDGLSLDAEASTEICNGKYSPEIKYSWEKKSEGLWYLNVENKGFFSKYARFSLEYDDSTMDMDTFNYGILSNKELLILLPPSGVRKPFLWVRADANQEISKKITIKIKDQK